MQELEGRGRLVVRNIGQLLTMDSVPGELGTAPAERILEIVPEAAVVAEDGKVVWVGLEQDLPSEHQESGRVVDAGGRVVMPGLVECHTHLLFAGNRANEFALRSLGATYEQIAAAGGGIAHTMTATRKAGADSLFAAGLSRLDEFLKLGVTTVESKSGYGLDAESEVRLLEVMRSLQTRHPVDVVPTFLGAHIVPPEHRSDRRRYIDILTREMIPEVARRSLAKFCDVFCEEGAFSPDESREILESGAEYGLIPKVHAEQLSRSGGALLAARVGAASADHLDFATPDDARFMAMQGTVAVLLPGATFFLNKKRYPDGRMFIQSGCEVALSTDYNPGSSHTRNLWLMGTMGCTHCGLSPAVALRAITRGAARAIRMEHQVGRISRGLLADFLILDVTDWQEILYLYGHNPVSQVYKRGRRVI